MFTLVEFLVREFRYSNRRLNDFFLWLCIVFNRFDLLKHFFQNLAKRQKVQQLQQLDKLVRKLFKKRKLAVLMKSDFAFPFIDSLGVMNALCLHARANNYPEGVVDALSNLDLKEVPTLQLQLHVWAKLKTGLPDEALEELLLKAPQCTAPDELAELFLIDNICDFAKAKNSPNEQLDVYIERWISICFDKNLHKFSSKTFHRRYINAITGVCHYYLICGKPDKAQEIIQKMNPALLSEKSIVWTMNFINKANRGQALRDFCRDLYNAASNKIRVKVAYVDVLLGSGEYDEANKIVNTLDGGSLTRKQQSHVWFKFSQVYRNHGLHESAVCYLIKYLELKAANDKLSKKGELIALADLSGSNRAVTLDWDVIFTYLHTYDFETLNHLLGAAFVRLEIHNFDRLQSYVVAQLQKTALDTWKLEHVVPLVTLLYKLGRQKPILELLGPYAINDNTLKMYLAFARNDPVEALYYRSLRYRDTFLKYVPGSSSSSGTRVLYPEKDLCGEVFSSFFYQAEFSERGPFSAICDDRLLSLYQRNFPDIQFIPKKSARSKTAGVQGIDDMPDRLLLFLDRPALARCEGATFFSFNPVPQYKTEACQNNLERGWIKPRADLQRAWRHELSVGGGKRHIAISANSTLSAPNRDVHMVSLQHWSAIFNLKDVVFINVNPAFDRHKCRQLAEQHAINVISPDFDLYNDFENLIAVLSVVDCAILPANSLMDFAAAVGVKTYVFSPTKIMRNWVLPNMNSYVFSNNVQFIMADDESFPAGAVLARRLAQQLITDFELDHASSSIGMYKRPLVRNRDRNSDVGR